MKSIIFNTQGDEILSDMQIAIVVAHSLNRLLLQFRCSVANGAKNERNSNMEKIISRLNKMLRQREKSNMKDFIFATEYERILWNNVTHEYDKSTSIFAINSVTLLYEYFAPVLLRYAKVSKKMIERLGVIHVTSNVVDKEESLTIEQNDDSFISTYIKIFEPHSGTGLRVSPFSCKKLQKYI